MPLNFKSYTPILNLSTFHPKSVTLYLISGACNMELVVSRAGRRGSCPWSPKTEGPGKWCSFWWHKHPQFYQHTISHHWLCWIGFQMTEHREYQCTWLGTTAVWDACYRAFFVFLFFYSFFDEASFQLYWLQFQLYLCFLSMRHFEAQGLALDELASSALERNSPTIKSRGNNIQ